jgi:hypothetical protein
MPYQNWIFSTILFLGVVVAPSWAGDESVPIQWPAVKPITQDYDFQDASHATVNLVLDGTSGSHLYLFHCRPGLLRGIAGEEADFNGDFDCHLHSLYSRDRYQSLLIDDPLDVVEAHSRGEVWVKDLRGKCGEYPDWGRMRSFRLRGMILKFEMRHVRFTETKSEDPKLAAFKFKVQVISDPTAFSSIAEPSDYSPPWEVSLNSGNEIHCDGEPVARHIPGLVTAEYLKNLGLNPSFVPVAKMTTKLTVDARDGDKGPDLYFSAKTKEPAARFARAQIRDRDGTVVYEFECAAYTVPGGITIAGEGLSCGLFSVGNPINLLQDSVDPFSRMSLSTILPRQLSGRAGTDSEWGNVRHFRLRGLLLTLKFSNIIFSKDDFGNPGMVRSEVTLEVAPEATEITPVAAPPKTPFKDFLPTFSSIPKVGG